jgi:hypothetical protein
MSNHIWTADGRILKIDIENKKAQKVSNVIEPFTLFDANDLKEDTKKSDNDNKKIIFVKPGENTKTLNNLCFYRDLYKDGTTSDYNTPPIIEISGTKCPLGKGQGQNSFGIRINNIRSVNDTKGTSTIYNQDGLHCNLNRKDVNDSYLNSLYFGDCISDPTYWSEEKDQKKIDEYNKKLEIDKISKYIPKLKDSELAQNLEYRAKFPLQNKVILDLDPSYKKHIGNNKEKDLLNRLLSSDRCLGGTSDVEKAPKSDSITNKLTSIFNMNIDNDKVSGKEGVFVNLYGNKCPENSVPYFGMDVKYMETTDANGNIRTFKVPGENQIRMDKNNKLQTVTYEKDEQCKVNFDNIDPLLKSVLVGDCNNPPLALKKIKSLDQDKDNYLVLNQDIKFKTKQDEKIPPRRPGLGSYDIKPPTPKCNYNAKRSSQSIEIKNMVSKCNN